MKVLVTGSTSKIGILLCQALLTQNHQVVAYDIKQSGIKHERLISVTADVRDFERLTRAARGCDTGIHLAILAGESSSIELAGVNVVGAYAFFQAARQNKFRNAVLASSAPVHLPPGPADHAIINESGKNDLYDLTKTLQEVIAQDFHLHGSPTMCIRFGHVVLGAQGINLDEHIPLAKLDYCRGGWVAIEDVVSACVAAMSVEPDQDFTIYNLVGSRSGRDRFNTAATERRLGISLQYDFSAYE